MGIYRLLSQWKEKVDGTLTGPSLETDSATVNGTTTTDALEADATTTPNGDVWDTSQNTHLNTQTHGATDALPDVTATSYTSVGLVNGIFDLSEIPSGAELYGYFYARGSAPSGETMDVRPAFNDITPDKSFNATGLDSVSVTFDGENQNQKSGWQKITELDTSKIYHFAQIQAQVSGGTGSFSGNFANLAITWRLK